MRHFFIIIIALILGVLFIEQRSDDSFIEYSDEFPLGENRNHEKYFIEKNIEARVDNGIELFNKEWSLSNFYLWKTVNDKEKSHPSRTED